MGSRDAGLLAKIAAWYYEDGLTQEEIARRSRVSRPSVSRLLSQAREMGIVQVKVAYPLSQAKELERRLEKTFGLKEAIVADTSGSGSLPLVRTLGAAAAEYLERVLDENDVLGVSWGNTLYHVIQSLEPRPMERLTIVQLCGGLAPVWEATDSADLVRKMAAVYGARAYLLQGPLLLGSEEEYRYLASNPAIALTLDKMKDVNVAVVGIGALEDSVFMRNNMLSPEQVEALRATGAVGDICSRFIGPDGREVDATFIGPMLAIRMEELCRVEHVVAVAGGPRKIAALRAALLTGAIDVVITDTDTAAGIVA
ncbi:MAG: sugar-binding transcriptional regulator [Firmicutes bacterium]|jgi:DNA-binding transcriptional regulator LsrR (DeoR family)|nr:sugar-binding transcriptional regulator [Bacillota bacterium]